MAGADPPPLGQTPFRALARVEADAGAALGDWLQSYIAEWHVILPALDLLRGVAILMIIAVQIREEMESVLDMLAHLPVGGFRILGTDGGQYRAMVGGGRP